MTAVLRDLSRPTGNSSRSAINPEKSLYVVGADPKISAVKSWELLLPAWEAFQVASGDSVESIKKRKYWVLRVADAFPGGPEHVPLQDLIEWMAGHDWKPNTRRMAQTSLRNFWSWAIRMGHVEYSPAHNLPRVRIPRGRPRPAPEADFRFALSISDRRTRLAIMLAGYCGMRRGEIARARREDMEPDMLGYVLRVTGKGGHERLVPLPDPVVVEIRKVPSGWLFPSTRAVDGGNHISAAWLGKLVTRSLPRDLTTHTLRHRCGTVAYARTKDLRAVQELLGHSKPEITALYTKVADQDVRAAMQAAVA